MTLIEMLVACLITAVIMIILWDLFGSGTRAAVYGTWYSSRVAELRTTLRMIREDLAKATYESVIKPNGVTVKDTDQTHWVQYKDGKNNLPGNFDVLTYHICRPDRTAMPEQIQAADIQTALSAAGSVLHYKRTAVSGDVKLEDRFDKDVVRDVEYVEIGVTPNVTGDSTGVITIKIHCTFPNDTKKGCDEVTTAKLNIQYKTL